MEILNHLKLYGNSNQNFNNDKMIDFLTVLYLNLIEVQKKSLLFNPFSNGPADSSHQIYYKNYGYYIRILNHISDLKPKELLLFISKLNFVEEKFILDNWDFKLLVYKLEDCINYDFSDKQIELFA